MNQRVKEKNKWIDRLINFVFYGCVLALIWLLLQITTFSSFRIPTASMHPTLIKGDYVIVNKWIAGGRIFNVFNAVKNKHISIKRIPGIRRIRKNDILIFNSPVGQYKNRIHFDVMQYYAKRCVGLPGDTVAIILPTLSALVEDSLTFSSLSFLLLEPLSAYKTRCKKLLASITEAKSFYLLCPTRFYFRGDLIAA